MITPEKEREFDDTCLKLYEELDSLDCEGKNTIRVNLTKLELDTITICLGIVRKQILWKQEGAYKRKQ